MKNQVQLITYPDSLGGNLGELNKILTEELGDKIGGVHILPFHPSSRDRGFSPLTYFRIDSRFGSWRDLEKISENYELMADLILNHISRESKIFQDYLKRGDKSKYKNYFISAENFCGDELDDSSRGIIRALKKFYRWFKRWDRIFHYRGVSCSALNKVYRPRKGNPFRLFTLAGGKIVALWCTFSRDQVDLNLENTGVRKMIIRAMTNLKKHGVSLLRLDAVGYVIKKKDTSCFMIPETYQFISYLSRKAHERDLIIIPEVRCHYSWQLNLAEQENVDYVYDFCLPALVLYSLFGKDFSKLRDWLWIRPHNQVTTLDTHDGIGIIDVEGFLGEDETENLIEEIYARGGEIVRKATGESSENVDNYQINTTYFSALGENGADYLLARAIQFFTPGVPQVYYMGWLAGKNDREKMEETGVGRDLNRHNYTLAEIKKERRRQVVKDLEKLMDFRSNYPAFQGKFNLSKSAKHKLEMQWRKDEYFCRLFIDLKTRRGLIEYRDKKSGKVKKWDFIKKVK